MNKFARLAAIVGLVFGASAASAIPLQVSVTTSGVGSSSGQWSLTGSSPDSGSWIHVISRSSNWNLDIAPGEYDWTISGIGDGLLTGVSWSLNLAGQQVYGDSAGGFFKFRFNDDHSFTAVSVPEPATLALLGMGLVGVGFAARRRRAN